MVCDCIKIGNTLGNKVLLIIKFAMINTKCSLAGLKKKNFFAVDYADNVTAIFINCNICYNF